MKGEAGQGPGRRSTLLGMAATVPSSSGQPDPLDPARAVRRCLADAGLKAFEISAIVVADELTPTIDELGGFARLALGPHGASVSMVAVGLVNVIGAAADSVSERAGLAVAVLHTDGWTVALCITSPRSRSSVDDR